MLTIFDRDVAEKVSSGRRFIFSLHTTNGTIHVQTGNPPLFSWTL